MCVFVWFCRLLLSSAPLVFKDNPRTQRASPSPSLSSQETLRSRPVRGSRSGSTGPSVYDLVNCYPKTPTCRCPTLRTEDVSRPVHPVATRRPSRTGTCLHSNDLHPTIPDLPQGFRWRREICRTKVLVESRRIEGMLLCVSTIRC